MIGYDNSFRVQMEYGYTAPRNGGPLAPFNYNLE